MCFPVLKEIFEVVGWNPVAGLLLERELEEFLQDSLYLSLFVEMQEPKIHFAAT